MLGIPLPGLMAPFVSYLELLGGLAIMLGLFTRPISLLFIGNMLVALILVSIPGWLGSEQGLIGGFAQTRVELLLLLGSACLAITGAGPFSLDATLFGNGQASDPTPVRMNTVR
jgi:putative oxidoreductase